ncbi:polysaccharide lyase family 8 super-sandwich domain-containing protein [Streptomyces sp. CBMA29]|uniref:polysaccharide lyase family 8 super-sandwich domain-containing protein n=1 Tax=Streptomyces sp. CBMA29 TaxID=1896314 RepID=UPI0016619504|nr:polysaccharide lyase family 8 super-sandwich domain-containing protein [Streptomyces sp. CBMA29]MBD0735664.1 silent information regulator protein Sir2 [Streptomyces sp. CBMA29]
MPISRRVLLSSVPAAGLTALVAPLRARAADGPVPASAAYATIADQAALIANTVAVFAGTAESNARPEAAAKLTAIESTARARLAALGTAGANQLFGGLTLGASDTNLTTSFQYLYETALATRVPGAPGGPGSGLRDDVTVQRRVVDGLAFLYDGYYGDQSKGYYGNWFNWEIGISTHVTKTLLLLQDALAAYRPDLTAAFVAAMDAYLRNGKDGDVDLDSRFHTGANLADITTNRILQGAVLGDDARTSKAIADQLTVFATIDPYAPRHGVTDGFYADGSFIQHASVAYTGSYGTGLLSRVVQTVRMLDGTSHVQGDDLIGVVQGWIAEGFAPLIFEGWMAEIVKGRAISRTTTGYADVATVVEAVTGICAYAGANDAAALAGYVRYVRQTSRAALDPVAFVSPTTVVRYADILADTSAPAGDLVPAAHHAALNSMDRTVHRRPGYAFALARSSARISKYEYMSGENLLPWFQGDGAHYLYLTGQDQTRAYGIDYLTVVSPYGLAGVTAPVETRHSVPELYGTAWYDNPDLGFTASSESQNTYVYFPRATNALSGGATLGAYGTAAFVQSDDAAYAAMRAGLLPDDFVVYRNADATKSWFMLDDEIVVLAAGVGDGAGRAVTTTLDTRIADPAAPVTLTGRLRDGAPWSGTGTDTGTAPLAWLRYADAGQGTAVGYVFLDGFEDRRQPDRGQPDRGQPDRGQPDRRHGRSGPRTTVALDTVARSRRVVRTSNPDTTVTKQVFAVRVEQAAGAEPVSMAYALVPHATEARLRSYARGPLSVVANSTAAQAIRHRDLGLLAVNTFTEGPHHADRLSVEGPASVLLREDRHGAVSLAVADPTTQRDRITLVLQGRPLRAVTADDGVRVSRVPGGIRVEVATRHAYGRSFMATLR